MLRQKVAALFESIDRINNFLRWPAINTDERYERFKHYIERIAQDTIYHESKVLKAENAQLRGDLNLLLNHLGLEVVAVGKREIRKVTNKEKRNVIK